MEELKMEEEKEYEGETTAITTVGDAFEIQHSETQSNRQLLDSPMQNDLPVSNEPRRHRYTELAAGAIFLLVVLANLVVVLLWDWGGNDNDGSLQCCGIDIPKMPSTNRAYKAVLRSIAGTNSSVTGAVAVFADHSTRVAYAGFAEGVEPNMVREDCTATNGCGVHIHSGLSCENSSLQGGHYYALPVAEDPWTEVQYRSNEDGSADFEGIVEMGTNDIKGRAFVVHARDGSRVACGLLTEATAEDSFWTAIMPLTDARVMGEITVLTGVGSTSNIGMQCFYGRATSLEPNLNSFLQGGLDCTATNGCGAHIHSGSSCANSDAQGGHYYDLDVVDEDPWVEVGYLSTDKDGVAEFVDCVSTGKTDLDGRAFLLHADDGSRASCGLLGRSTKKCFSNGTELKSVVDSYWTSKENDVQSLDSIALKYGLIESWCVSFVEDFSNLFGNERTNGLYTNFNEDLSKWDTSSATNMSFMFDGLHRFNSDLTNWDVSKVSDMQCMFRDAKSFNQDISDWNVSHIKNFNRMFMGATSLERDLCSWGDKMKSDSTSTGKTLNVTEMFAFSGCLKKDDPLIFASIPGPLCDECDRHGATPLGRDGA